MARAPRSATGAVERAAWEACDDSAVLGCRRYGIAVAIASVTLVACGRSGFGSDGDGGGSSAACPASYAMAIGTHKYRDLGELGYGSAKQMCVADQQQVLIIDDDNEATQLILLLPGHDFWAGIEGLGGTLQTAAGQAPTYQPWGRNEPSSMAPGTVAAMLSAANAVGDPAGKFYMTAATNMHHALCECAGP